MLDRQLLKDILDRALRNGGDYADIYIERSRPTLIVLEGGRIEKVLTGTTAGAGVRVLFGGKTAYATTNDLSAESLKELALSLGNAVSRGTPGLCSDIKTQVLASPGIKEPPDSVPTERKVDLLMGADKAARKTSNTVMQVSATYRDTTKDVQVAASTGDAASGKRVIVTATVNVVAGRDGLVQTGYEAVSGTGGFEVLDENALTRAAAMAAARAHALLGAQRAPGGRMPVVIASEAGGTMIHEAIGHGLEADLAGQGLSRFSNKLGQQVASPLVSVIDDPTLPGKRGSYAFDDEGSKAGRNVLVDRGVLKGYMHDRLSALREGAKPTGNGRRESYRHRPVPRMSNTFIAPGETNPKSVIASVDRGLLVTRMGGGQVNTVNGDFVFDVSEGYIIDKGRKGELVRGATLTGNGPEVLMSIDMVGSDLGFAIGTCGKDGQGVPVSDAMPTLRIPDIVVGGEV